MTIISASVTIRGTRPLFWHYFGRDAIPSDGERKVKTGAAGNDPEEWRRTVLVTKDGQLYMEPTYIFGTLRNAAIYTKKGLGNLQKSLSATLQVIDDRILVDRFMPGYPNGHNYDVKRADVPSEDRDTPVYLDVRAVVNPKTKGRNIRYRIASSPGWTCTFKISWENTLVNRNQMEAIIRDAGNLVGLGNGRTIGMGRFEIASFDVID
jgi:hypothetical protein